MHSWLEKSAAALELELDDQDRRHLGIKVVHDNDEMAFRRGAAIDEADHLSRSGKKHKRQLEILRSQIPTILYGSKVRSATYLQVGAQPEKKAGILGWLAARFLFLTAFFFPLLFRWTDKEFVRDDSREEAYQ